MSSIITDTDFMNTLIREIRRPRLTERIDVTVEELSQLTSFSVKRLKDYIYRKDRHQLELGIPALPAKKPSGTNGTIRVRLEDYHVWFEQLPDAMME
ncbi:MAG: hypothetical protein JW885_02965 [Deltaproteobacteria bacterium]|nr:hypothetical protein [Candidatus Zymogenaceae bacterium]